MEEKPRIVNIEYKASRGSEGIDYIVNFNLNERKIFSKAYHISHDEKSAKDNPLEWAAKEFINSMSHEGYECKKTGEKEIKISKV
jgi:hypothetical protein